MSAASFMAGSLMDCVLWTTFSSEIHLLERRAAQEAIRARQRLEDLKVVVALPYKKAGGLARRLERGGEIARHALELRRLERAIGDRERRADPAQVALRAERVFHRVGELHVARARGKACRLQVVQSARAHRGLDEVRRQVEVALPVGG